MPSRSSAASDEVHDSEYDEELDEVENQLYAVSAGAATIGSCGERVVLADGSTPSISMAARSSTGAQPE